MWNMPKFTMPKFKSKAEPAENIESRVERPMEQEVKSQKSKKKSKEDGKNAGPPPNSSKYKHCDKRQELKHSSAIVPEKSSSHNLKRRKSQLLSPNNRTFHVRRKSATMSNSSSRRLSKKLINLIHELKESNSYYKNELKKSRDSNLQEVFQLQKENEVLRREPIKSANEIEKLKRRCHELEDKNVAFSKSRALSKENEELNEDLQVCKSVICRLNEELLASQEKLGINGRHDTMLEEDENHVTNSCSDSNETMKHPRKYLLPLLVAYDEVITEKNEIIRDYENSLKTFKSRCKEIVKENQELYSVISDKNETGTVSVEEWQALHTNALVVLEENDILHEEIKLLKQKEDIMMKSHQEKVYKLRIKLTMLAEDRKVLQQQIESAENRCTNLREQQSRLSEILEKRIPLDQHEASVNECKILFEELKTNYNTERQVLGEKLEAANNEKNRLLKEIVELEGCNTRLQSAITTCEETLTSNVSQFKQVYSTMIEATKARDVSTVAMEETMILSQRIIEDRANTEGLLQEQKVLNGNLLQFRERQSVLIAELQRKTQEMEDVHAQEVEKYVHSLQELERNKELLYQDYQQRTVCLESLIEEKSKHIDHLEVEKRQLQADLETVWKTTTSTMKDIANTR